MRIVSLIILFICLASSVGAQLPLSHDIVKGGGLFADSLYIAYGKNQWQTYVKTHQVKSVSIASAIYVHQSQGTGDYADLTIPPETFYTQEEWRFDRQGRDVYYTEKYVKEINKPRPKNSLWLDTGQIWIYEKWQKYDANGRLTQTDTWRFFEGVVTKKRKVYFYDTDNRYLGSQELACEKDTNVFILKKEEKYVYIKSEKLPVECIHLSYARPDSVIIDSRLSLEYDDKGRLIRESGLDSDYKGGWELEKFVRTYEYKGTGEKLSAIITNKPKKGTQDRREYEYDSAGRLSAIALIDGETGKRDVYCEYRYDAEGRIVSLRLLNSNTATIKYNKDGNIAEYKEKDSKSILGQRTYQYDKNGALLSENHKGNGKPWEVIYTNSPTAERREVRWSVNRVGSTEHFPHRYRWEYWTE